MNSVTLQEYGHGQIVAILAAIIASIIFGWQTKKWARLVPTKFGKKGKNQLLNEYKNTLRIAKFLSGAGLLSGGLLYLGGRMKDGDLRGFGVGIGLMSFLPVCYIFLVNFMRGPDKVKEAMTAYVIAQKTPPKIVFLIFGICFVLGVISGISLLFKPF